MSPLPKRVHVIGICGVATSALAIAFHKKGVKVTGSDKGFYPPVSTYLNEAGVSYYAGWHPEHIAAGEKPDFIMIGGVGTSPSNPEYMYAQEQGIPVYPYAEVLEKYFIKKNSVVVAGTWGKTTTSSLLSFIMIRAGLDPSYFTGGLSLSHATGAVSDSDWSIVEGDEYQVSISDRRPKFVYYAPTHLLLTSVSWDHADLYPTEKAYFDEFTNLVKRIPTNGRIVACSDDTGVQQVTRGVTVVTYGRSADAHYCYGSVTATKDGLDFSITHTGQTFEVHSPMLGRFNAENIAGAFALACEIGIKPETTIQAIADFKGIKRRFEKRLDGEKTVLDCHAPTADKAASVLEAIREVYPKRLIAVYEPNIGGRQRASAGAYDNAFKDADIVIIPHLTKLKVAEHASDQPMEGDELAAMIGKTHASTNYIENDQKLVTFLKTETQPGDVVAFLGSHGFRGMIEETVAALK
jgi:UDP-N-acetylmuramate: L-alanyl-gamma-D-glutamyl-meso-diaminopimelate ligase